MSNQAHISEDLVSRTYGHASQSSLAELIFLMKECFSVLGKSLLGLSVLQTVLLNLRVIQNFFEKEKNV